MTLKASPSGWNLVVLGRWDPLILTPEWVGEHVAEGEVTVELPHHARLPPRVSFDGVSTLVVEGRLVITPAEPSGPGLHRAEQTFGKILQRLPHTPVTGTGINFQWSLPLRGAVAAVLAHPDDDELKAAGLNPGHVVVRRKLRRREGGTVNVTVETDDEADEPAARVSVNHHADTSSAAQAAAALEGKTGALLAEAEQLVTSLYGAPRDGGTR